jgi:hypothetical protein
MKAAAEAWGVKPSEFKRGFAKETHDPAIVAATMAKPGVVLRRPVGSNGPFSESLNCRGTYPLTKSKTSSQSLSRRQKHRQLARSTIKPPAPLHLRSSESRSGATSRVGRKKPGRRRSANTASRQSQRRKEHWNKPSGSTTPGQKSLRRNRLHSTDGRRRRTRAGKRNRENSKPLCDERATSAFYHDPPELARLVIGELPCFGKANALFQSHIG